MYSNVSTRRGNFLNQDSWCISTEQYLHKSYKIHPPPPPQIHSTAGYILAPLYVFYSFHFLEIVSTSRKKAQVFCHTLSRGVYYYHWELKPFEIRYAYKRVFLCTIWWVPHNIFCTITTLLGSYSDESSHIPNIWVFRVLDASFNKSFLIFFYGWIHLPLIDSLFSCWVFGTSKTK